MRSIRGGALPGTPGGSAASRSSRSTSRPAGRSRRLRATWSSRARTSDAGARRSGSGGAASARTTVDHGEHPHDHTGRGGRTAGKADAGYEVGGQPRGGTPIPRPRRTPESPPQARRAPGDGRRPGRAVLTGVWWSSSAHGSTTSANAPRNSPNNAGQTSTNSACAGKRGAWHRAVIRSGGGRFRDGWTARCPRSTGRPATPRSWTTPPGKVVTSLSRTRGSCGQGGLDGAQGVRDVE